MGMKRWILLLMTALLTAISHGQAQEGKDKEDVTITINVSKIDRALGKVVEFGSCLIDGAMKEMKQFADEIPPEEKKRAKETVAALKERLKRRGRYLLDCIHAGWSVGWRGEEYVRPYDDDLE